MSRFIHLRATSAYSLLEGAMPVKKLAGFAQEMGLEALGLCDRANLFGALEFSEAMAGVGIQPITGLSLPIVCETDAKGGNDRNGRIEEAGSLCLYARNGTGYQTLMRLASRAHLEGVPDYGAAIRLEWLLDDHEGLLVTTGGAGGLLEHFVADQRVDLASNILMTLQNPLGDRLYVEVQRYDRDGEAEKEYQLTELAYELGLPLLATNTVLFAGEDDFDAHDVLLSIGAGTVVGDRNRRRVTRHHRFKSPEEMMALFADLPEATGNTVEFAKRCVHRPTNRSPILPGFAIDDGKGGIVDEDTMLETMADKGLEKRLAAIPDDHEMDAGEYWDRLEFELGVIRNMKYAGYFLIVADFIQWAKDRDIPVGPGRGSGAGSVVAWALTITDLDPIRFGLLFERFLNPERVSMPDFDIDFCPERREEVIGYVQDKYGHDQVAQIITFGTLQARAVMRDVGRALQMSYGQVDGLCKLVPNNPTNPVKLPEAIDGEPQLQAARDEDPLVAQLLDTSVKLEGLYRHPSTHAAGIVIGDRPLDQLVPLFKDQRSEMPVTQFNMKWAENAGLVKFDFLGLKTLTVLDRAKTLVRQRGIELDLDNVPLDDRATFNLLSRGETVGIFQLESAGMRDALRVIEPDRFEDIIALVALYRPGPMENIPTYGARKHGREEPDYLHPLLEEVLKETYGVIIYQEQVMEIARVLSGYSLGEADLLRRAMGKKIREEMDQQRSRFVDGAVANDISKPQAQMIFDLVARFADYGFNKSHAAAYALVAYQTAFLKANYPVEFYAASMTLDLGNTDKLAEFYRDAKSADVVVNPPNINRGQVEFSVRDGEIEYGLAALKNVGSSAVEHIVAIRAETEFSSMADFTARVDGGEVNRKVLEGLAASGAFDALKVSRSSVFESVSNILESTQRQTRDRQGGQSVLFDNASDGEFCLRDAAVWTESVRLSKEFDSVGFFLSGHPLDAYQDVIKKQKALSLAEFKAVVERGGNAGTVACVVTQRQEKRGRKGARYAILQVSDPTDQAEIFVFSDSITAFGEKLVTGSKILATVEGELRNGELRLTLAGCQPLDDQRADTIEKLKIYVAADARLEGIASRLPDGGMGIVELILPVSGPDRDITIELEGRYRLNPEIVGALKAVEGVELVRAT